MEIMRNTRKPFEKRMKDREELVKAHEQGKLADHWYSIDKKGKKYLSPKKLAREGY